MDKHTCFCTQQGASCLGGHIRHSTIEYSMSSIGFASCRVMHATAVSKTFLQIQARNTLPNERDDSQWMGC